MSDIKFVEGIDPSRPGAFYVKGSDLAMPGAALAIFERLKGRPATPAERAEYERHVAGEAAEVAQGVAQPAGGDKPML